MLVYLMTPWGIYLKEKLLGILWLLVILIQWFSESSIEPQELTLLRSIPGDYDTNDYESSLWEILIFKLQGKINTICEL